MLIAMLLVVSLISAIGVANSYWDDKPLKLAPGESTRISLRLQNEEDNTVTMQVKTDSEIVTLPDGDTYDVPPGKISVPVYLDVKIPEDVSIGKDYTIYVDFKEIASGEGGGFFQVAQGITGKVPVEIVSEQESELYNPSAKNNSSIVYIILGVVLLVLIILVIRTGKKRNN